MELSPADHHIYFISPFIHCKSRITEFYLFGCLSAGKCGCYRCYFDAGSFKRFFGHTKLEGMKAWSAPKVIPTLLLATTRK